MMPLGGLLYIEYKEFQFLLEIYVYSVRRSVLRCVSILALSSLSFILSYNNYYKSLLCKFTPIISNFKLMCSLSHLCLYFLHFVIGLNWLEHGWFPFSLGFVYPPSLLSISHHNHTDFLVPVHQHHILRFQSPQR